MTITISTYLKTEKTIGALLGAAYGDALGWPNERIRNSYKHKQIQGHLYEFRSWVRRSGGRFHPYEEIIEAGEYSDDTQLILCLCRSLLKGGRWWEYFTKIELPFWSVYERGGGGATKRAVNSWLDGAAPWSSNRKPHDVKKYFEAGGNGVAMRVLPHILYLSEKEFPEIASNIFRDGIATHGHPRALLGALAYGFALWIAFCKDSNLAYGELVEELIKNKDVWSDLPVSSAIETEWKIQAEKNHNNYSKLWKSAKTEILDYLYVCQTELSKGALSLDDDALKELQCFNSKISGAGTVAATAAIYLASRHAADPINGVVKAAFAIGSDTDTIASMTGGLLGCINGTDWLSQVKKGIQDNHYIENCALQLTNSQTENKSSFDYIRRSSLNNWIDEVLTSDENKTRLPDQRIANISHRKEQVGLTGKFKVKFQKMITKDGQSLYISKITKGISEKPSKEIESQKIIQQSTRIDEQTCGSKIPVNSFEKSLHFYQDCLGLTVKKQNHDMIVFEQGLVLVPSIYAKNLPKEIHLCSMIYIQTTDIEKRYSWLKDKKFRILSQLAPWRKSGRLFFRSLDPDGNVVEVFSADNQNNHSSPQKLRSQST